MWHYPKTFESWILALFIVFLENVKKRLWHQSFASKHSYQQRFLPTQILTGTNSYQQSLVNTHSYQQRFLTKILTNAKFLPKESCHKHSYQHKFLPTHIFTNIFYYQQIFVPAHFLTIRFSYQHRFSSTETLTNKNTSNNTSKNTNKKTPTTNASKHTNKNIQTKKIPPKIWAHVLCEAWSFVIVHGFLVVPFSASPFLPHSRCIFRSQEALSQPCSLEASKRLVSCDLVGILTGHLPFAHCWWRSQLSTHRLQY